MYESLGEVFSMNIHLLIVILFPVLSNYTLLMDDFLVFSCKMQLFKPLKEGRQGTRKEDKKKGRKSGRKTGRKKGRKEGRQ